MQYITISDLQVTIAALGLLRTQRLKLSSSTRPSPFEICKVSWDSAVTITVPSIVSSTLQVVSDAEISPMGEYVMAIIPGITRQKRLSVAHATAVVTNKT